MSEIKISADLTEAIEKLSEKLGISANSILPHYSRLIFVNGIVWVIGGLAFATLPWLSFAFDIPIPPPPYNRVDGITSETGYKVFFVAIRFIPCVFATWGGLHCVFNYIENVLAPKAMAISKLLNQIMR